MTGDDIGLSFFTQHAPRTPSGKPSVFGPVDQDALISRIDAVDEDDLDSTFFGDSILDVENASTRAFDIGIRTLGSDPHQPRPRGGAVPTASIVLTTAQIDSSPAPAVNPIEIPVPGPLGDDAARTAFILGGPAGLA